MADENNIILRTVDLNRIYDDDDGNDVRDRIKKVVLGPGVRNCGE